MKYKALKDIATITMGQSPDSSSYNDEKSGIPFYQGNADFGELYPTARVWCSRPKKIAKENDILISVRAPIGALNYATEECCIGRGLAAITIENDSERNYVFHLLKAKNKELNNKGTGSTFKAIGKSVLEEIQVPVISKEQQEISMKLMDIIEQIIRQRKQELQRLDDLIKARFVEMFGNPVLNNIEWKVKPLGDLTTKIGSGATPKGGKEAYRKAGISFIRSMNVHNGQFDYKELAHISDEQASKLDNVIIEKDDVLLNITGASVARSCIVPSSILPARVNQHVCIVRCNEFIIPEFLNKLLIDDNFQNLLWNIAGSGATREAITKQQVENLQIIVPPIKFQNTFMEFCKQVDKSKVKELLATKLLQQFFNKMDRMR